MLCFNPRARRGRDVSLMPDMSLLDGFNPRARRGRDLQVMFHLGVRPTVSIHAPAGGATPTV